MQAGFTAQIETGSRPPSSDDAVGQVYEQSPAAGSRLAAGGSVRIVVYRRTEKAPEGIAVPNLAGLTKDQVVTALEQAGLVPRVETGTRPPPTADAQGKSSASRPRQVRLLARGGTVTVQVYTTPNNPPEERPVPNLKGLRRDAVEDTLRRSGHAFQIGEGNRQPPSDDDAERVYSQSPAAGAKLPRGETVLVMLYPRFDSSIAVPNVIGSGRDVAEMALRNAGLSPQFGEGARKAPAEGDAGRVYNQSPAAGARLARGETVSVLVYGRPAAPPNDLPVPDLLGQSLDAATESLDRRRLCSSDRNGSADAGMPKTTAVASTISRRGQARKYPAATP